MILDEALRRGYSIGRDVEAHWTGGRHVHLRPPVGPDLHFPLPPGMIP